MRKRTHRKSRACGLCKPHKKAMANRWKPRELAALKEFERTRATIIHGYS